MKPWRGLSGITSWVLRLSLVLFIYVHFFNQFMQFHTGTINFYISAGFLVLAVLLLAGGILKQGVTVVAALGLVVLCALMIFRTYQGVNPGLVQWLLAGSVSLYFFSNGNKT